MVASDFLKSAPPTYPYTPSWRRKHALSSASHTPPSSPTSSTDCSYFSTDESSASQDESLKRSHQTTRECSRRRGKFTNSKSQNIPSAFSSLSIARYVLERERSEPLCRCDTDMIERASPIFAEPTPPSSPENVHTSLEQSPIAVTVLRRSPRFKSSPPIKGASRHNPSNSSGGPQYHTPPQTSNKTSNRDTVRYGKVRFSYLKPTEEEYKGLLYSGSENLIEFMTDYDLSIAKKSDLDVGKHILNLFGEVEMLDICAEDLHVVKKRILSRSPLLDPEVRTDDGN